MGKNQYKRIGACHSAKRGRRKNRMIKKLDTRVFADITYIFTVLLAMFGLYLIVLLFWFAI